jgi:iron complex outermembrane receptor protein
VNRNQVPLLLAASALTSLASPAWAQTTPSATANEPRTEVKAADPGTPTSTSQIQTGDGDIVVTAQRRSERLTDVPISITAITPETMAAGGVTTTTDLDRVTPGLTFTTTASHAQPNVRGVGSALTGPGADNNVAIYVDGVYQAAQSTLFMDFNNIQQIEVLKGPQGTLFGRNATGGAITIKTLDPSKDFDLRLGASYGSFEDIKLTGYVSVPLGEKAAFNVAGLYRHMKGYVTNLFNNQKIPGPRNTAFQAKLLLEPTDNFRIILSGSYMDREDQKNEAFAPYNGKTAVYFANPSYQVPGPYQTNQDQQPLFIIKTRSASLRTELDLEAGTLSTITGYIHYRGDLGYDNDQSPGLLGFSELKDRSDVWSQEVNFASHKFGAFSFVAGLYYYNDDAGRDQPISATRGSAPFLRTVSSVQTEAYAAYAEGNLDLSDRFHVIAGMRYSHEHKKGEGHRVVGAGASVALEDSWEAFTPRLALRYELSGRSNVYASYSKGFKSGVFNVAGLQALPVQPENINAYEIGFKTSSRGFRFNTSAFYYDYKDIQVQSQLSAATLVYQNAAAATIYGGDFDFSVDLAEDFSITGGAAYTHGRYDKFPGALTTVKNPVTGVVSIAGYLDQSGKATVRTPEISGNISANFHHKTEAGTIGAASTLSYIDKYFVGPDNRAFVPGNVQLSGELSYTTKDDRLRFALWGKNLTNEARLLFLTTGGAGDLGIYDLPRTYGVSVAFNFK